jgi:hypothetical protein
MSLTVRKIKAKHYARQAWSNPYMPHPFQQEGCPFDDYEDDEWDDNLSCTHCGGEGYREVEDPLWDDCDEFGYGPCTSCDGTGRRDKQWVF